MVFDGTSELQMVWKSSSRRSKIKMVPVFVAHSGRAIREYRGGIWLGNGRGLTWIANQAAAWWSGYSVVKDRDIVVRLSAFAFVVFASG